jgi:hypothetical protein
MREQKKYYKTTLERIKKDYYGVVMDFAICKCICPLLAPEQWTDTQRES